LKFGHNTKKKKKIKGKKVLIWNSLKYDAILPRIAQLAYKNAITLFKVDRANGQGF